MTREGWLVDEGDMHLWNSNHMSGPLHVLAHVQGNPGSRPCYVWCPHEQQRKKRVMKSTQVIDRIMADCLQALSATPKM